jgi:hypothetical protein
MSPEELAERHPHLYHVTDPEALPSIMRHGLLPASGLLSLFETAAGDRPRIECARRPVSVVLSHPIHGCATINDNLPLSVAALSACLDDKLTPRDWLRLLNRRVFFWADEEGLSRLLGARLNRDRERVVLVLDTLSVARQCFEHVELSPINSGATLRRPARRGLSTFAPMRLHSYEGWRRLRGRRDRVLEVTLLRGVTDVARHLVEVRHVTGGTARQA